MSPAARERRRVRTPVLVVTEIAWLVTPAALSTGSTDRAMDVPAMHHMSAFDSAGALLGFVGMWSVMLGAMLAPLLISPLRHVGARSLPRRRPRARTSFLAAYAAMWLPAGIVLVVVAEALERVGPAVAIAVGGALLWQFSPVKQRCLNRHHACPPLAAFGSTADRDALRFGASRAVWSFGSCWTLMLLPLVFTTGQLVVMVVSAIWMWAEQFDKPVIATWRLRVPITAVRIVWKRVVARGAGRVPLAARRRATRGRSAEPTQQRAFARIGA